MADWKNATLSPEIPRPPTASTAGVLRPAQGARHFDLARSPADPGLSPWVERYWRVSWSLPPGTTYVSSVLTHPAVHLTVESGAGPRHGFPMPAALLHGVVTRRFDVPLVGIGMAFGVKFRPGGFGAFTGHDVAAFTDTVVPLAEALGPEVGDLQREVGAAEADAERVRLLDDFLLARRPAPDARYEWLLRIVADMLADASLVAVHQVCERHQVGQRSLQRLFRRYVGVGPKWVLQRFRLLDAQAAIDAGEGDDLAELAARLGWFDQAHFSRDFRDLVGQPPSAYAAAQRETAASPSAATASSS